MTSLKSVSSLQRLRQHGSSYAPVRVQGCPTTKWPRFIPSATDGKTMSSRSSETGASPASSGGPASKPACPFDTNYWHYSRYLHWWQQRAFLVPAGLLFIVGANLMESPGLKTTILASIPVALLWYLALYLVPKNFARYAEDWANTHPQDGEAKRTTN